MNKAALKKFATEARLELLEKIELQARKLGITAESIQKANVESSDAIFIDGRQLSNIEKRQRNSLISRIDEIGFEQVIEETAYTWFNRFMALRFMEVNDYLPSKVRVLSSSTGSAEPDMIRDALSLELELDKEYIYELKLNNKTDELFKYLIKAHCNDLNQYMPFMFETIEDFTEILFPESLLGTDSFVRTMTDTDIIPEDNWNKVEIVGWLYQYYISDENERVIKAKKRYKAEELPFATQLFTPEWIVRYMVQNALGRYWIESHPEHRDLIKNWEFYLENKDIEFYLDEKLAHYINKSLNVEDIKCFDPAMGSGHILVYMFDVLYEIYSMCGYVEREIPRLIIENNLYGLDIDDRAYQLASFSVFMRALKYNPHFLRSVKRDGLDMNLVSIQETNSLTEKDVVFLAGESTGEKYIKMSEFINQFKNAKSIGSLIKTKSDIKFLEQRIVEIEHQQVNLFESEMKQRNLKLFKNLVKQVRIMQDKYDIFITNPPYVGSRYLTKTVSEYLSKYYPDVKRDLFSSFMEYSFNVTKKDGQIGFMTPFVWMFISSYEKLRKTIIDNTTISTLVQLEYSGFDGATVPICTFTLKNYRSTINGEYIRLSDFRGAKNQSLKTLEAVRNPEVSYRYSFDQKNVNKIPGKPIAYWINSKLSNIFSGSKKISDISDAKQGLATADNNRFLRLWHEVDIANIGFGYSESEEAIKSKVKWFPYNKGGGFMKWFGNNEFVINWENNGYELKEFEKSVIRNQQYYFKESISWCKVTSSSVSFRHIPQGFLFDVAGCSIFTNEDLYVLLGTLNSRLINEILKFISPTLNYEVGHINNLPIIYEGNEKEIGTLAMNCVEISKNNWDSFEESWNFLKHPFLQNINNNSSLEKTFERWSLLAESKFYELKENEEKLNEIFIKKFDLQDIMTYKVLDNEITIRKAELERDVRSFISYFVGCTFGRYSLDEEGLIFAGGEIDFTKYQIFSANKDNILPVLSDAYFEDDIVSKLIEFVKKTFNEENLEENLNFIADSIGRRNNESSREVLRRYFLKKFFKDHVKVYRKRPIYWLFTSGKEQAFNCLVYMHRYDKTTLSRIRTDYLHEVQTRLDAEKIELIEIINGDSTPREITSAKKNLKALELKIDELKEYDEKLHHMADMQIEIDLDDGVKANYDKFEGLVAKIK